MNRQLVAIFSVLKLRQPAISDDKDKMLADAGSEPELRPNEGARK